MRGKWSSWINLLLGVWLLIAPFALGYSNAGRTTPSGWHVALGNDIIVGVAVIVFAAIAIAAALVSRSGHVTTARVMGWASWVVVALGVWEIVAPFALNYSGTTGAVTNDILVGAGLVVFGLIAALTARGTALATRTGYDAGHGRGGTHGRPDTETTEEQPGRDRWAA